MKKCIFVAVIFALFLCLIDSAIISHIDFFRFRLQAVLILLIYISLYNGSMTGVIFGFFAGLILDFLSLAPMGLHSTTFVIIAFIFGKFQGKYDTNKILIPAVFDLVAILMQSALFFVFRLIFGKNIAVPNFLLFDYWIGIAISMFFAPILFFIFNLFPVLQEGLKT